MSLLEELQLMYGGGDPGPNPQLGQMLSYEPQTPAPMYSPTPPAPQLSMDPVQPIGGGGDQSGLRQPGQLGDALVEGGDPDIMKMYAEMVNGNAAERERMEGAGAPAGMHASSIVQRSQSGGVPTDVAAQGVAVRGQAELQDAGAIRQQKEAEAARLEAQAQKLREDAAREHEAQKLQEAEIAKKQERLRSQQMDLAKQNDEPINPSRYYENMSGFQKGAAIISAAIYGFLNPQNGGVAPVAETLMQLAQQDTQAQLANAAANRSRRSAIIEQYEREYGDTTLVAKRLEADKLLTLSKEATAQGMSAKSQEARDAAALLTQKMQSRVGVLHQEIQEAMYGKPVETTTTYQPNAPKGSGTAEAYDKAAKAYQSLAAAGVSPEDRVKALAAMKLPTEGFGGKTAAEQENDLKRADAEAKKTELTPDQKSKAQLSADGLAEMTQGLRELDDTLHLSRAAGSGKVVASPGGIEDAMSPKTNITTGILRALPWKAGEGAADMVEAGAKPQTAKTLNRITDSIVFGLAKTDGQGALSGPDLPRYRAKLPTNDSQALLTASEEIYRVRRQKWRNLVAVLGLERATEEMRKRNIDPAELDAIQE